MDRTALIFLVGLVSSVLLWLSAALVWAIWIQRYVERYGKAAPFALTLLTGWGPILDYRRARRIAAQQGYTPWFLRCFAWLAGLGMCGFIALMAWICIRTFY